MAIKFKHFQLKLIMEFSIITILKILVSAKIEHSRHFDSNVVYIISFEPLNAKQNFLLGYSIVMTIKFYTTRTIRV